MSDTTIGPGGAPLPQPNTFNPIAAADIPGVGTPICLAADGSGAVKAEGNTSATSSCVGLTLSPVKAGSRVATQYAGPRSFTTVEITGMLNTGTSFTPGAAYYLSELAAGKLTLTPPAGEGHFMGRVAVAIDAESLLILIGQPLAL